MSAKPHISDELKANIAEDLAIGCSVGEIADRYGVSFSIIQLLKQKAFEKYKPSLLNWIDERSMEKSPEVVQAPTKTVSEDITDSGSSADTNIIPEVPENVKPCEYSPYESAVDEAVLERIEKLHDRIADLQLEMSNYESEISRLEEYHLKYLEVQNNERINENR